MIHPNGAEVTNTENLLQADIVAAMLKGKLMLAIAPVTIFQNMKITILLKDPSAYTRKFTHNQVHLQTPKKSLMFSDYIDLHGREMNLRECEASTE